MPPVDEPIVEAWALLSVPDPLPLIDGLLAATAWTPSPALETAKAKALPTRRRQDEVGRRPIASVMQTKVSRTRELRSHVFAEVPATAVL